MTTSSLLSTADSPLFSIVTISYNQAQFLDCAVQSVLNQTFRDYEYLVFDGGSTDGSDSIIGRYANSIDYWQSCSDGGPAAALAAAVDRCRGRFLMYINSDDWLLPHALETMSNSISKFPHADVLYGHGYCCDESSGRVRHVVSDRWGEQAFARGLVSIFQQSSAIRLDAIRRAGGFNSENRTCWDGELLFDIARTGGAFVRINDFLAVFRVHAHSITGSQATANQYVKDRLRMARKVGVRSLARANGVRSLRKAVRDPLGMSRRLVLTLRDLHDPPSLSRHVPRLASSQTQIPSTHPEYQ